MDLRPGLADDLGVVDEWGVSAEDEEAGFADGRFFLADLRPIIEGVLSNGWAESGWNGRMLLQIVGIGSKGKERCVAVRSSGIS